MKTTLGCSAPNYPWPQRRTRWRVIVLVILIGACGWLIEDQQLGVLETGGALVFLGLAAAVVIDRVIDGGLPTLSEIAAAVGAMNPPPADGEIMTGRS